jgi:hypothetical protein
MAEQLTFKQKMLKTLYGMGMKNFGPSLLGELKKGGLEWQSFVHQLLEGNDYPTRKIVVKQLTSRAFVERSPQKAKLIALMMDFLGKGLGDEKREIVKFIDQNLQLFPREDDGLRSKIMALQREKDIQLSAAADALLPKLGVNMDDPEMYRRH